MEKIVLTRGGDDIANVRPENVDAFLADGYRLMDDVLAEQAEADAAAAKAAADADAKGKKS